MNSQSEFVLESNYEKYEEQNGTALQITFDSYEFEGNVGHSLIDYNVTIVDEDGHEYKVKELNVSPKTKRAVASHIYYELIGDRKYDFINGDRTFNQYADWLFTNTGWTYENLNISESFNFNSFGQDNFLQLIQKLITAFDCEMKILPNKVIRFAKRLGNDFDKQYRFRSNIKSISQSINTANVRTRIVAFGANGLTVTYTSPLANDERFGFIDAEPVTDENIQTQAELIEFARRSLKDLPDINVEVSVLDIDGNVGDYVWVIHEELGIELQSRILSKRTRRDYNESEVQIGNAKKRTIEDVLIDQKTEIEENKDYIESVEEETEEKLAILEVSDEEIRASVRNTENTLRSEISITAGQIRSEVEDTENRLNSTITQTASEINLRVSQNEQNISYLSITADQIQSNVSNLANSTNSSITQLSNSIELKVDVGGSISDINLSQGTATINADKINLNGAVIVNGSITGSTDITVGTNVAVGNALYFGGSQGSIDFINISGSGMTFSSTSFNFSGSGSMYLNGRRVLTEDDL